MKDLLILLIIAWLTLLEGCEFEPSLAGPTWWTGYVLGSHPAPHTSPPYRYDVFGKTTITTFTYPKGDEKLEQWRCIHQKLPAPSTTSQHVYVVQNLASQHFECRWYRPVQPAVLLYKRHTYGVLQPRLEECEVILNHIVVVDVMVQYVNGLVAMAPCPFTSGNYTASVHYEDGRLSRVTCPPGRHLGTRVQGARVSNRACGPGDHNGAPFRSDLFCVSSWRGNGLTETRDRFVLLYRYDLPSSHYTFYIARYQVEGTGLIKMTLKSSPDNRVTFNVETTIGTVDQRHSFIVYTPIKQATQDVPPVMATTSLAGITPPGVATKPSLANRPWRHTALTTGTYFYKTTRWGTDGYSKRYTGPYDVSRQFPVTSCRWFPCENGGRCTSDRETCWCPVGTAGNRCQEVNGHLSPTQGSMALPTQPSPSPLPGKVVINGVQEEGTPTPPGFDLGTIPHGSGLPPDWAAKDHTNDHALLVSLVSLSVGFSLLSAFLCVCACCRKGPAPLVVEDGDQRELLKSVYQMGGELVPAYSASYSSRSVQAWFPDYKTPRVGGSTAGGPSTEV